MCGMVVASLRHKFCGNSSVGRALASQAKGRGFESRFPLKIRGVVFAIPLIFGYKEFTTRGPCVPPFRGLGGVKKRVRGKNTRAQREFESRFPLKIRGVVFAIPLIFGCKELVTRDPCVPR